MGQVAVYENDEDDPEVPSSVRGWRRDLLGVPLHQTPFAHFAQGFFEQRGWWVDQFIEHASRGPFYFSSRQKNVFTGRLVAGI